MRLSIITVVFALMLTINLNAQDTLTTKSGLKYVRVKAGDGKKPVNGQTVKVHYTAKFTNGKEFETSRGGKPFKFEIVAKEVIPGWDEGFKLMSTGEVGVLIIPAKLAYGKYGTKDPDDEKKYIVPPNTDLVFEVELISIK